MYSTVSPSKIIWKCCVSAGDEASDSHIETPGSETSGEVTAYQTCANVALKVIGGLLVVLCVSSSWVGTTQVVQWTFKSFSCPFFISWFSTNWNILFFPLYYSGHVAITREKQTPIQKFRWVFKINMHPECSHIKVKKKAHLMFSNFSLKPTKFSDIASSCRVIPQTFTHLQKRPVSLMYFCIESQCLKQNAMFMSDYGIIHGKLVSS